jgi:hypothetical protein
MCAILQQRPNVLGVDLDTSKVRIDQLPKSSTRIVWSQRFLLARQSPPHQDELQFEPESVLAGQHPEVSFGLAVAKVAPDWSVREIYRCHRFNRAQADLTFVGALTAEAAKGSPLGQRMSADS